MDQTNRQITKIAREVQKFTVRTLRADGIGPSEMDVLHVVRKRPGCTQADVCNTLGLDKGAVARIVRNLESKGYLTRAENPADGRSRLLLPCASADGLKRSKAHVEAAFYDWLLEPLPEQERAAFVQTLEKLYQRCKCESRADFPEMTRRMGGGAE